MKTFAAALLAVATSAGVTRVPYVPEDEKILTGQVTCSELFDEVHYWEVEKPTKLEYAYYYTYYSDLCRVKNYPDKMTCAPIHADACYYKAAGNTNEYTIHMNLLNNYDCKSTLPSTDVIMDPTKKLLNLGLVSNFADFNDCATTQEQAHCVSKAKSFGIFTGVNGNVYTQCIADICAAKALQ